MQALHDLLICAVFGMVPLLGLIAWVHMMITRNYRP